MHSDTLSLQNVYSFVNGFIFLSIKQSRVIYFQEKTLKDVEKSEVVFNYS